MPKPSELFKPPAKFKGTPDMREQAEHEAMPDFIDMIDDLPNLTALELITWHSEWYLKVGHVNLCRFYLSAQRAHLETAKEAA
ncbi:MAG: hypothetical protein ACW99G_15315 [Candidatus Thorarchaeota archaeon]|jgi:hypothetical protein